MTKLALAVLFLLAACNRHHRTNSAGLVNAPKIIFATTAVTDGALDVDASAAMAAADLLCNDDSNKPTGSSTYKALLRNSLSGANGRHACTSANCASGGASENLNWVLAPDQTYVQADGETVIGTTNDAAIILYTAFENPIETGSSKIAWTGLYWDWTSIDNCNDWTATTGFDGQIGDAGSPGLQSAISISDIACPGSGNLYCVEQ